jgi:hypothetical protein
MKRIEFNETEYLHSLIHHVTYDIAVQSYIMRTTIVCLTQETLTMAISTDESLPNSSVVMLGNLSFRGLVFSAGVPIIWGAYTHVFLTRP